MTCTARWLQSDMPRLLLCLGFAGLAAGPLASQPVAEESNAVTGMVVNERGSPATNVEVVLRPYPSEYQLDLSLLGHVDALPEAVDRTRSGSDGSYSLSAPRPGPYLLEFRPPAAAAEPRLASPLVYGSFVPLKGSRTAETVEIPNLHVVAVRVLDRAGQPVEGALVVANPTVWVSPRYLGRLTRQVRDMQTGNYSLPQEQQILPTFYRFVSHTDPEGIARFRMPTQNAILFVSAPGFIRGEGRSDSGRAVFRLQPAPRVRLRVSAPGGSPVAGVLVRTPDTTDTLRHLSSANLLQVLGTPGALGAPGAPVAITDANGEAVVPGSSASQTNWELEGPDHTSARVSLAAPAAEDPPAQEQIVDVRLEHPRRIPGRVVDTVSGLPVDGAAIWVQTSPGHNTYSGSTGAFDLNTDSATTGTRLQVAAAGYIVTQTDIAASDDPNPAETRIGLTPEAPIRGLVTDTSGAAIGGARVRAQPRGSGLPRIGSVGTGSTTSASDGSFRVEEVVFGYTYRLIAQAAGYASTYLDLPPLQPGAAIDPVHLVLSRGRQVHGAAVDTDGKPVAEANVALLWPLDQSDFRSPFEAPAVTTTTNEQGAFVFPAVAAGDYALRLRHPEYADRPPADIDIPAGDVDLDLGDLTLVSGGTIHGVVASPDGEPVAGASLQARARNQFGGTARTARTDADGRFRIDGLSTDLVDLGVRASGYPLLVRPGVRADSEEPVLIELLHGGLVTGRVVDAGGNSAAGVPVRLRLERDYRSGGSPLLSGPGDSSARTVTDEEGRFQFDELMAGTWSAEARKGAEAAKVEPFELAARGERDIELALGTADRLTVIVTAALNEPVAGATVRVQAEGDPRLRGYEWTDGSGHARIDISPGPATVKVEHEQLRDESRQVELTRGDNEVRIELHPAAEIAGTVRSYDGALLALATIEARTEHSFDTEFHRANTVSDQAGAFRITGVEPGRYNITARSPGHADGGPDTTIRVGLESIEGIEIVLEPEARIVGVVTGLTPSDLAQVEIRAWRDSRAREATPDTEGNFSLEGLSPGTWRLTATRGVPGSERRLTQQVSINQGSAETFVELRFERGLRLSGQVLDGGEPLAGARLGIAGQSTRTDREGYFAVEGLEPGRKQVLISRPDFSGSQYHSIDLQSDFEGVRIELEPAAATIAGTVINAATGQPIYLANLVAADAATIGAIAAGGATGASFVGASSSFSQPEGQFELELRTNADHLWITRDGYESLQIPLSITPGERQEGLVIQLQPRPDQPN